jgi:hypothetical protein
VQTFPSKDRSVSEDTQCGMQANIASKQSMSTGFSFDKSSIGFDDRYCNAAPS